MLNITVKDGGVWLEAQGSVKTLTFEMLAVLNAFYNYFDEERDIFRRILTNAVNDSEGSLFAENQPALQIDLGRLKRAKEVLERDADA